MTDEIKRVAERIAKKEHPVCVNTGYLDGCELYLDIHEALLAERRKAYEECADLVENKTIVFKGSWIGNDIREFREQISNEISRRIKDESTN